jgi:predicted anti-sigma-YlaC factor YlaD
MDCKRIKELITTDYIDRELDEKLMKEIAAHLRVCKECSVFEESLRKTAIEPFKNIKELKPPEYLWKRIKENIEKENKRQEEGLFVYIRSYLQSVFAIPRPIFAATAVIIVCIILGIILKGSLNSQHQITDYLQDQIDFISSLDVNSSNPSTTNHNGFDTTIEEYFS